MMDTVRILRVLEYVGPRASIERIINNSIKGSKTFGHAGHEVTISAVSIGEFPEILKKAEVSDVQ